MMNKRTNTDIKAIIKAKLATNRAWSIRALVRIYEFQTADEQHYGETTEHNHVGFNGLDANILSSFATQVNKGYALSQKQMNILFKKMPKYWSQVASLIPEEKLQALK